MRFLMALVAFGLLAVFLGILAFSVNHNDLTIVCAVALAMCGFDFYRSAKANEQH
ncbi:MAG TPA: hypothetical protein VLA39_02435 [Marinobacterium sp.]|nr:hypothetical protein [Marinobacterium sp.]